MKEKLQHLIYTVGILGFVFSSSIVFAQPPGPCNKDPEARMERMEKRMERITEELDLSDEQQEHLKAHKAQHREEGQALRESMMSKKDEFRAELEKQALDMERVYQLHSEIKDLKAKMADHRLEGILEIREILSPEQFSEFMELKGKHKGRKKMRHRSRDLLE